MDNVDRKAARCRRWRENHPGAQDAANRAWFAKDPEHARRLKREAAARYRARQRGEDVTLRKRRCRA